MLYYDRAELSGRPSYVDPSSTHSGVILTAAKYLGKPMEMFLVVIMTGKGATGPQ